MYIIFIIIYIQLVLNKLSCGKHRAYHFFNICVMFFSNKKLHYNRVGQQFSNAPCRRVTFSL